jgi:hypothetical protein
MQSKLSIIVIAGMAQCLLSLMAQEAIPAPSPSQTPTPAAVEASPAATPAAADVQKTRETIAALRTQSANIKAATPTIVWDVLPVSIVRDNYGHNVASKYVAIDVVIHNNDPTTQLLIRGFRFNVKSVYYANTDPTLVRGTIEKGQMVGARNRSVQAIKTIGLIATGAGGYFHAPGPSANFNRAVAIFSDPFEKGIELIFPDTTVKYLANWDKDTVFKNGFVVDPGKDSPGRLFLPVELVCSPNFPEPPQTGEICELGSFFKRNARYDANLIKKRLGTINLLGNSAAIVTGQSLP